MDSNHKVVCAHVGSDGSSSDYGTFSNCALGYPDTLGFPDPEPSFMMAAIFHISLWEMTPVHGEACFPPAIDSQCKNLQPQVLKGSDGD